MAGPSDVRRIVRLRDTFSGDTIINREPQRSYMFEVLVHDKSYNASFGDLKYYVKSIELPTRSREPIVHDYMDTKIFYSGRDASSHTFTITFWDDQSLTVYDYMHKWLEVTGSSEYGEGVYKQSYVRDIKINLKDTTDLVETGSINLKNCFPTEIGSSSLNYDDSNVFEIPITFTYDYVTFGDFTSDISNLTHFKSYFGL